jgi:hypothetical protein
MSWTTGNSDPYSQKASRFGTSQGRSTYTRPRFTACLLRRDYGFQNPRFTAGIDRQKSLPRSSVGPSGALLNQRTGGSRRNPFIFPAGGPRSKSSEPAQRDPAA